MAPRNTLGLPLEPRFVKRIAQGNSALRLAQAEPETLSSASAVLQAALRDVNAKLARMEQLFELIPLLLAMAGVDPTHVPIEVAALALGVSVPTIRRRIRKGELPLDIIPGTKVSGVPIQALYEGWISIRVARAALARERAAATTEHGRETGVGG